MPNAADRFEDTLIDLFLSQYEGKSWAGSLASKIRHDRTVDRGVEVFATRLADGRTLAIEHTLIEPFVGEKADFHNNFKELQRRVRSAPELVIPGHALYVRAPVNVLPLRSDWNGIIDDVINWLVVTSRLFSSNWTVTDCVSAHHPRGRIAFQVRLQPLGRNSEGRVFVQRYGDLRVGDSVTKALSRKLPKLVGLDADIRILMLERDQSFVMHETIVSEVENLRATFPTLASISEVWIADTASFDDKKEWIEFSLRLPSGEVEESFSFFKNELESHFRGGYALPS